MAQNDRISSPPIPTQPAAPAQPEAKPAETKPAEPEKKAEPIKAEPVVPSEYVVQSGDNPWVIAKNHGVSLRALLAVNDIKDAKNLNVGDILKLPSGVESKNKPPVSKPVAAAESKAEAPAGTGEWELYTIEKGDNPWKIAKTLKVNHQEIVSLNKGLDFTKLNVGQQIKVPKKK